MSIRRVVLIISISFVSIAPFASASTSKPITTTEAGAQYLADVVPLQNATNSFTAAFNKWVAGANASPAQTKMFVEKMIAAETAFGRLVLRQSWPANVERAIQRRVSAQAPVVADLERLPTITVLAVVEWTANFQRDDAARVNAANLVRSDLGLPLIAS